MRPLAIAPLLLLLLLLLLGGCTSFTLPSSLSEADQKLVESTHFKASVGVAEHSNPDYSLGLLEALRATGLFDRVQLLSAFDKPDLIARVREPIDPTEPLYIIPFLTAGVIPAISSSEWGEVFSLHSARDEGASVPINFRFEGSVHVGWLAMFTGMAPNRSWAQPMWHRRYGQALAAVICRNATEIQAMLAANRKQ